MQFTSHLLLYVQARPATRMVEAPAPSIVVSSPSNRLIRNRAAVANLRCSLVYAIAYTFRLFLAVSNLRRLKAERRATGGLESGERLSNHQAIKASP
jgi:hypothetical protein